MRRAPPLLLALLLPAAGIGPAHAGPYSDGLGKCLVESTTAADKSALVKWMFATAALHPAVKSIATVSDADREQLNRNTAQLFTRLVSDSCRVQTQQAIQYEGPAALQTGFQMLGQVAARELFSDPAVAGGLGAFAQYFDRQKLEPALQPPRAH